MSKTLDRVLSALKEAGLRAWPEEVWVSESGFRKSWLAKQSFDPWAAALLPGRSGVSGYATIFFTDAPVRTEANGLKGYEYVRVPNEPPEKVAAILAALGLPGATQNPYYGQNRLSRKPVVKRASPRFSGTFSETPRSHQDRETYLDTVSESYFEGGPGEHEDFMAGYPRPKQTFDYKVPKPAPQGTTPLNWPLSGRAEGGLMGEQEWVSIGHSGHRARNNSTPDYQNGPVPWWFMQPTPWPTKNNPENPAKGPVRAHNIAEPVSYNQGRAIGAAVGGLGATCGNPDLEKAVRDGKLSHADVLTQMGLNRGTASVVLQGLSEMGLLTPNFGPENVAKAQKAQAALFQVGGVSCLAKKLGGAAPAAARPYTPYVPKAAATAKPPADLKLAYRAAHGPKWFENEAVYAAYRAGTPPVAKSNPRTFAGALSRKDRNKRADRLLDVQARRKPEYDRDAFNYENGHLVYHQDRVDKKMYYKKAERPSYLNYLMGDQSDEDEAEERLQGRLERYAERSAGNRTDLKLAYRAAHGPKRFENEAVYAAYRAGTPPIAKKNPQSPWPRTVGKKPLWHLQSVENGVATYQAKAGFTFPGDAPGVYSTTIGESEPGLWYRKSSNGYSEFFSKAEALQDLADA